MRHAKEKTDLVWNLTQEAKFIFLSRPRRFGKSLLTTTLVSYFKGQKELFEGLKIMELEKEWERYPVIHLDMSAAKGKETSAGWQASFAVPTKKQGNRGAIIIDEYDAPLLEVLHEQEQLPAYSAICCITDTELVTCMAEDIQFVQYFD